jgi:Rod binding domain-containing protein
VIPAGIGLTSISSPAPGRTSGADRGTGRAAELQRAAAQLEGIFLRQLLKSMRKTVPESALFGRSMGKDIYTEMFDGAIADEMAKVGGIGIRDVLLQQLGGKPTTPVSSPVSALRAAGAFQAVAAAGGAASPAATIRPDANAADKTREVLGGVRYEAPDRPERLKLGDGGAGGLRWPVGDAAASRMVDDRGTIAAPAGDEILAAAAGRVVSADATSLVVDHGRGLRTRYVGLGAVQAQPGDLVLKGQTVGSVASFGSMTFVAERRGQALGGSELSRLFGAGGGQ